MIGVAVTDGLVGSGSARGGMLGPSLPDKPVETHFSSKLSGSFPAALQDLKLGTPFTLKPAARRLLNAAPSTGTEDTKGASQQMESYFIYMMMKEMWATLPEDGFLDSGLPTDIFQQMWLEKVSDQLATSGPGIGLAAVFERDIQSKTPTAPPQIVQPEAIPVDADYSAKPFPIHTGNAHAVGPPKPSAAPLGLVSTPLAIPPPEPKLTARAASPGPSHAIRPPVTQTASALDLFSSQPAANHATPSGKGLFTKPVPLPGTLTKPAGDRPEKPVLQTKPKAQPAPKPKHVPAPKPKPSGG